MKDSPLASPFPYALDEPDPATGKPVRPSESKAAANRARARIEVSFADEDLPPVFDSHRAPAQRFTSDEPRAGISGARPDSEDDYPPILNFAELLTNGANTLDRKPRTMPPVETSAHSSANALLVNRIASTVAPGVARSGPRLGGVSLSDVPPPVAPQVYESWNGPTETARHLSQEPIAIAEGSMHDALSQAMPRSYTPENTGMDQESLRVAIEARRREVQNAIATAPPPARSGPHTRRPSGNLSARPSIPGASSDRASAIERASTRPRSIAVREEVPASVRKRDPRSEE